MTSTQTTQTPYQIGGLKINHLVRIIPTEKLDKKWTLVPDRPTPSDDEIQTIAMLDERWGIAKRAKELKHDIWNQSYLQYRSVNHYSLIYGGFPTYWNQWGLSVFIPRTFETIESIKTQMLGRQPDFSVEPTRPSQSKDSSNMNYLMKSEYKRSKTQVEVVESVHDALVYGSGVVRTDFVHNKEQQWTPTWQDDGSIGYTEELVTTYSGVGSRRVDPYDFYPDPSPESHRMDKLGYSFERSVVDAWELREQYRLMKESGAYGVTDNWKYVRPGGDTTDYKYIRQEVDNIYIYRNDERMPGSVNDLIGRSGFSSSGKTPLSNKGKIEVREYWEKDRYIVEANGLILRDSPNPYPHKTIPYAKFSMVDMNDFWSMGIPEIIRWLQIEENLLHDQGLNNIVMSVHKMFAVNSRYIEDEGELVVRPFGIIHLKQIPNVKIQDAIMPIEYNMNMNNYFEFMRMAKSNIETVTGVSPYQTGGLPEGADVERATVANRLSFAGQARVREISRHVEDSLVMTIVEHYVAIAQFYYQNPSAFEDEILSVEVDDPAGNYFIKFIPKSSEALSESDLAIARSQGYNGVIGCDQIQGRMKVLVNSGSTLPKDPEDLARLKLEFFNWAKDTVTTEQVPQVDPATGQTVNIPVQTPMFDVKKIAREVVKDVYEVSNPDDYFYKGQQEDVQQSGDQPVATDLPPESVPPPEFGGPIPGQL